MTANQILMTLLLVPIQAAIVLGVAWLVLRNWFERSQLIVAATASAVFYWIGLGTHAKNDVVAGVQLALMPGYPILLSIAVGWYLLRRLNCREEYDR